ncbi:MAG: nickel-binding protein [Thermodesulfobacteriota bacterium]
MEWRKIKMPIYMDRHYIEDTTPNDVENAHQKDIEIQDKYGIKVKTYWFDEKRCTAFCLVEAPSKEAVQQAHNEAHGFIATEIIEVDPLAVAAFLGRIKDPVPENAQGIAGDRFVDSAFRTIMFTDLKDSTAITTRLGDKKALHLLHIHNALIRNALKEYNGREIKHTGDGFMVSFASVPDAVKCAVNIQQAFAVYNEEVQEEKMHIRIGMSAGEPVHEDGDLFGTTVQLASRLCGHADPDRILTSQVVRDQCLDQKFLFFDLGEVKPKGFDHSVQLYEVKWQEA